MPARDCMSGAICSKPSISTTSLSMSCLPFPTNLVKAYKVPPVPSACGSTLSVHFLVSSGVLDEPCTGRPGLPEVIVLRAASPPVSLAVAPTQVVPGGVYCTVDLGPSVAVYTVGVFSLMTLCAGVCSRLPVELSSVTLCALPHSASLTV